MADFIKCVNSPTFIRKWCFYLNNRTSCTMFMALNFHCSSCIMRITLSYRHYHHLIIITLAYCHTDDFFSHLINRFIIKSLIDLCLWHLGFNLWTTQNKTIKINQRKILPYKNRMNIWMMPTIRKMIIRPPSRSFSPRSRLAVGSSLEAVPHGSLSGGTWTDS